MCGADMGSGGSRAELGGDHRKGRLERCCRRDRLRRSGGGDDREPPGLGHRRQRPPFDRLR
eukprot:3798116-Rhodomonas_salina.4